LGRLTRDRLSTGSISFRKAHLQSLIDTVEVDDAQIRIRRSKDVLEKAVLASRGGTLGSWQMRGRCPIGDRSGGNDAIRLADIDTLRRVERSNTVLALGRVDPEDLPLRADGFVWTLDFTLPAGVAPLGDDLVSHYSSPFCSLDGSKDVRETCVW
jgi:hypothetical protein